MLSTSPFCAYMTTVTSDELLSIIHNLQQESYWTLKSLFLLFSLNSSLFLSPNTHLSVTHLPNLLYGTFVILLITLYEP